MWPRVLSREAGEREDFAALKHSVPGVKLNLGEVKNQLGSAQGNSWDIQALPCRSTFFFFFFFFSCWENEADWQFLASTPPDVWL